MKFSQLREIAISAIDNDDLTTVLDAKSILVSNESVLGKDKNFPKLLELIETYLKEQKTNKERNAQIIQYDFTKYELIKTPYDSLWDKTKFPTLASFLTDYLLPTFHKCPDMTIQHPVMACFALFNSAAIPDKVKKPNALCCGQSRTGKSQYASLVMRLVSKRYTKNIKGNFSPLAVTQNIHNACYVSGENTDDLITYPSVIRFDNIYIKEFINRLADHYVTLLALEKGDSVCTIGGKEGGTYFPWAKYVFTTVDIPYRDNDKMSELLNRTFVFYFGKGFDPDLDSDNYSWSGIEEAYSQLWNKEDVEENFFPLLVKTGKVNKKTLKMEPTEYDISRLLIATGVYAGLFQDIQEGITTFETYWHYVRDRQNNVGNLLYKLVDEYLNKYYYPEINTLVSHKNLTRNKATKLATIPLQDIREYLNRVSNGVVSVSSEKKLEELEALLSQHDLVTKTVKGAVYFMHRSAV